MSEAGPSRTLQTMLVSGERLPVDRALALVRAIALAIDTLHAHQVVHGALCPSTIQVETDGRVLLLASDRVGDAADGGESARAYWSPQRLAGEPARHTDDLYALGMLARVVLAGAPNGAPDPPLPPGIEAVLAAQCSWAPSGRYVSGAELAGELERAAGQAHRTQTATADESSPAANARRREPEPAWAAARRVALAREAHRLAQAELPYRHHRERMRTMAHHSVRRRDYPDFPLPGGWVAVLVAVLCSVYLFPLYYMLFPHG